VIGNAVKAMRIATGEEVDTLRDPSKVFHRKGGLKGGKARLLPFLPRSARSEWTVGARQDYA
jgi:hypothetical protein